MRTSSKLAGSVAAVLLLASAASWGHARLTTAPPPRDANVAGNDAHKAGPCGGVAKGKPSMKYAPDAGTVTIKWEETIDHTGCFVLDVSPTGNDNDFKTLKVVKDTAGVGPKNTNIFLDGGLQCANCTFRLRQLMNGTDSTNCNANTVPSQGTYYSCADIMIGDFDAGGVIPVDDGGTLPDEDSGTAGGDSGTTPGADGGKAGVDSGLGGDNGDETLPTNSGSGCSTSPSSDSGFAGLFALSAVAALAVARAKRKQK
jgi:MYXO-CTERM domain-containing protein